MPGSTACSQHRRGPQSLDNNRRLPSPRSRPHTRWLIGAPNSVSQIGRGKNQLDTHCKLAKGFRWRPNLASNSLARCFAREWALHPARKPAPALRQLVSLEFSFYCPRPARANQSTRRCVYMKSYRRTLCCGFQVPVDYFRANRNCGRGASIQGELLQPSGG